MKIAANLSMLFTDLPLADRVVAAAAAGFDGVEIQFPYELPAVRLKELLERAGMPLCLINLPAGDFMEGGPGLAAVPDRQQEFDAALEEALSYAAMVRPERVNVLAGRLAAGVNRSEALECLKSNLRKAAEGFSPLGIGVVTEAINPFDAPGFLINTPEHLSEMLTSVNHPNLTAQLDIYHMARQGLDLNAGIRALAGRIGHVQFADCPGRGAPGTGDIHFESVIECLFLNGYSHWFAAEYRGCKSLSLTPLGWLENWKEFKVIN